MVLVDFHSHILPEIDDGSRSIDESIKMLNDSKKQGVGTIVATPHFYADIDTPSSFIKKRDESVQKLLTAYNPQNCPKVCLGAEVGYFSGISHCRDITKLCIAGTSVLMIEMPFCRWSETMVEDIIELSDYMRVNIILAHIDRYLKYQRDFSIIEKLVTGGVLLQANCDSFIDRSIRNSIFKLFDDGFIHVIGSDCHDTQKRPSNIGTAVDALVKHSGKGAVKQVFDFSNQIISTAVGIDSVNTTDKI